MNRIRAHIIIFCLAFSALIIGVNQAALAQSLDRTVLGVSFSSQTSEQRVLNQLPELKLLGMQVIELHHPVSAVLIDTLANHGFQVFVRSNLRFLTRSELLDESTVSESLAPFLQRYSKNPRVQALGVYSYSQSDEQIFSTTLTDLVSDSLSVSLYQHHTQANSGLTTILAGGHQESQSGDYFYFDERFHRTELDTFKNYIKNEASLILVDAFWLQQAVSESELFEDALKAYSDGDSFLYTGTNAQKYDWVPDWPVIFLLIIWLSLGIHMLFVPTYRPLIFRYFTFHRFFVDDVMRYRERSSVSGIFLLVQNAFLSGLMLYTYCMQLISEIGLQAFYYHLPYVGIFGQNYFSIFALTVVISLLLHVVCLIWIFLPSKSMNHFSQAINLYTWIFHLNFLIVSFGLLKLITGTSTLLTTILLVLFLIVALFGFLLATYDSAKYLVRGRFNYMMITFGSYVLVIIALLTLFLYSGYPLEVIKLSFAL